MSKATKAVKTAYEPDEYTYDGTRFDPGGSLYKGDQIKELHNIIAEMHQRIKNLEKQVMKERKDYNNLLSSHNALINIYKSRGYGGH